MPVGMRLTMCMPGARGVTRSWNVYVVGFGCEAVMPPTTSLTTGLLMANVPTFGIVSRIRAIS